MKQAVTAFVFLAAAIGLAGCGESKFLDVVGAGKSSAPGDIAVKSNQNLAMPPDLRLPAPGAGTSEAQARIAAYEPPAAEDEAAGQPAAVAPPVAAPPAAVAEAPAGDVYERNGISKTRADGKPKTEAELQDELKKVYIAKKRQTDPNYGTIWNLGNVFKDG